MAGGPIQIQSSKQSEPPPAACLAVRGRNEWPLRTMARTPQPSRVRATSYAHARSAPGCRPERSQDLSVSSSALDKPIQQQPHPKGSLTRGGLQKSSSAIFLPGSGLFADHGHSEVAKGPDEAVFRRHLIKHHSGLRKTPSREVIPL